MTTVSLAQITFAATVAVAAVLVPAVLVLLARLIRDDGYGSRPAPAGRTDWGTSTLPSRPFSTRL
jgi:hypothetical protein